MKRLIRKSTFDYGPEIKEHFWDGSKANLDEIRNSAIEYAENFPEDEDNEIYAPDILYSYPRLVVTPDDKLYVAFGMFIEHRDMVQNLGYSVGNCAHLTINYGDGTIDLEYPRSGKDLEQEQQDIQKLIPSWTINVNGR